MADPPRRFAPAAPSDLLRSSIAASIDAKRALLDDAELLAAVEALADAMIRALRDGGKVLLFGNGGSAADATHLAAELVGRFKLERDALPALSLTDNVSSVTAIGNDYAYAETFARQVRAFGREGDVAVGLSTSGRSVNVLRGLEAAAGLGLVTASITGSVARTGADHALCVPGTDTARVQECTMLLGHAICELVEVALFAAPAERVGVAAP